MTYQGLKSDLDILQSSYQPYQDDPGAEMATEYVISKFMP